MKHEPQSPPWSKGTGTGTDIGSSSGTASNRGPAAMATVVLPQPKQIRFVNNEGRPPAKRRRVDSACQTCRKRKIRCDGVKPKCNTCLTNRHECLGYASTPPQGSGSTLKSPVEQLDSGDTIKNEVDEAQGNNTIPLLNSGFKTNPAPTRADLATINGRRRSSGSSPDGDSRSRDRDSKYSDDDGEPLPATNRFVRVPYFRWFGPTAIVKGYKQMIAHVPEDPRRAKGASSISSASPRSVTQSEDGGSKRPHDRRQSVVSDTRPELPSYDDDGNLHPLITSLVNTFFTQLGCSFPFLQKEKVLKMVEARTLESVLVNVICALAARFSTNSFLAAAHRPKEPKWRYGRVFADRAKASVTELFICPSIEGAQAMLLLAYEAFGADQDSALWHYEGLAIRMVIDLGLEKEAGIKIDRRPRRNYLVGEFDHQEPSPSENGGSSTATEPPATTEEERRDTLLAIFALDRYISSGLGRPVTMRIEDFELHLPDISHATTQGLAPPLPALLHIMEMYGRVSDSLNSIRNVEDVTADTIRTISDIEGEMLLFYTSLDKRLEFSIENFVKYLKHGEGTNFIMLHLWFHTLVILVNCPTVCDDKVVLRLNHKLPYALLSAKTIADLADAAQFEEGRTGTVMAGNPFTTQPLYVAACAFLYFMKRGQNKTPIPSSREDSPEKTTMKKPPPKSQASSNAEEKRREDTIIKAKKGYDQCYTALQNLEMYWAGTKYILTALDQKFKGITDPEAFTEEEMESTKIKPHTNGLKEWMKRSLPIMHLPSPSMASNKSMSPKENRPNSPQAGQSAEPRKASHKRTLFAMTGTTNSPNSHLTWGIQPADTPSPAQSVASTYYDPIRSSLPESVRAQSVTASYAQFNNTGYHPVNHQRLQFAQQMGNQGSYNGNDMNQEAALLIDLHNSPHPQNRPMGNYDPNSAHQAISSPPLYEHNSGYPYGQLPAHYAPSWASQQQWQAGAAGGAPPVSYQSTEMDMQTMMQNIGGESNYNLDFLPWTEGEMADVWGVDGSHEDVMNDPLGLR